jgi:hypothetical protein
LGQAALRQLTSYKPVPNVRRKRVKRDSFSENSYFDKVPRHRSWDDSKFRHVTKVLRDSLGLRENPSLERDLHRLLQQYKQQQEIDESQKKIQSATTESMVPTILSQKSKSEANSLSLSMPVYQLGTAANQTSMSLPGSPMPSTKSKHRSWAKPKIRLAMPQDRRAVYLASKQHSPDLRVFHNPLYRVKLPTISRIIRLPSMFYFIFCVYLI